MMVASGGSKGVQGRALEAEAHNINCRIQAGHDIPPSPTNSYLGEDRVPNVPCVTEDRDPVSYSQKICGFS